MVQLLNDKGKLNTVRGYAKFKMTNKQMLNSYRYMVAARAADEWAFSLNRQGRLGTYAPCSGQEANSVGSVMALRDDDWIIQSYRELGGLLVRGVSLEKYYMYWYGDERGSEFEVDRYHITPISIPIASQLPHAVGISYAERYLGSDRVAIVFVGDGGTSEGDFHEALNFAGLWKTGTVFYVQNNQYALSVPRNSQTASTSIAEKAKAYGFEGVQVDGNDLMGVYAVTAAAVEKARSGGGPTLIEGITYRIEAHTTSDNPLRYRDEEEVKEWKKKDPIIRLQKYLVDSNLIDKEGIEEVISDARSDARRGFNMVEKSKTPSMEESFQHVYAEMPYLLKKQLKEQAQRLRNTKNEYK